MNNSSEYQSNQKKQRKSLKKYRKSILKALLWGGIGIASAFLIPYGGMFSALKGFIGESIAMNATFFTQWGVALAGVGGAVINGIKAIHERNKIEKAQDEEEDIVDRILNENDNLSKKIDNLEKQKTKEENKKNTMSNDLTKNNRNIDIDYEEEKEKVRTK